MSMATKILGATGLARRHRWSTYQKGLAFLVAVGAALALLTFKAPIATMMRQGETITAEFSGNYQLIPNETKVKLAGLEVGVVSEVDYTDQGTALVSMKVDETAVDSLGSRPSAQVAPLTVLGGQYAVELQRGGTTGPFEGESIPVTRTRLPVELDRILESLPQPTRQSLQDLVGRLGGTLERGGRNALRDLVTRAPGTLRPAGEVLQAAQGTRPEVDLPQLVTNLHATAETLAADDAQLGDIVESLDQTTIALARNTQPLADSIGALPNSLRSTRAGMAGLRGTLTRLTVTAQSLRPAARQIDPLLRDLNPVLVEARPVMQRLRPLMVDARPLVRQLVPVTRRGTEVLGDLKGPVLQRVNGPIAHTVMNTWRGTGPYRNSGGGMQADHKFYEELAYLVTNLGRASMTQDAQGSLLGFQVGANTRSVVGTPFTLANLLKQMHKATGGVR